MGKGYFSLFFTNRFYCCMKYSILKLCVLVSLCILRFDCFAIKHIGKQEGLSHKRTFSLQKDSIGFVWIATKSGIDRYDGTTVKSYSLMSAEKRDNLAGRINKLVKDKSGILWAYTNDGQLFKYDDMQDRYVLHLSLDEYLDDLTLFVNGILFVDDSHVFIYGSFGLGVYDFLSDKFLLIDQYRGNNVLIVAEIDTLTYAIGTQAELLLSFFEEKEGNLYQHECEQIHIKQRIQCVHYESEEQLLFIGTFIGKLYMYDVAQKKIECHPYDFKATIRDIERWGHTIYVGTDGGGLFHLNDDGYSLENVIQDLQEEKSDDRPYAIYDLLIDDNRMWIATYTNGIYLYDKDILPFRSLQFYDPDEQLDNSANAVIEDSYGNIWLGTNQGVSVYNPLRQEWKHLLISDDNSTIRHNILSLCEDDYGTIWAGGVMGETAVAFDAKTQTVKRHLILPNRSRNNRTYNIFNDSNGYLWFGGLYGKLAKYNPQNGVYEQYDINYVNVIYEKHSQLFIGTTCGLYVYNRSSNLFTQLLGLDRLNKLQNFINVIYVDESDCIWLGTEGGLIMYNQENDSIITYCVDNGLPSNSVYSISPDNRGRLWISMEKGLTCFDCLTKTFVVYEMEDGLLDDNFKVRATFRKHNGELMFGSTSGVVYFQPDKIDKPQLDTKLVITDFLISNNIVLPHDRKSPLLQPIDKTDKLLLEYTQNTFSFQFAGINFSCPGRNAYEWMLEGYDKDWLRLENNHMAYYTNVPYGRYIFKLRVLDRDSHEQIDMRIIHIRIKPPLYATLLAKCVYVAFSLGLLWMIIIFVRAQIEKSNVAEKMQFFTNTAHELKTPITLIKGPLTRLQEDNVFTEDENILLQLAINNVNRLYRIVSQLIDLQKVGAGSLKLFLGYCDIVEFMNMKMVNFQALLKKNGISLIVENPYNILYVWTDVDKLDKVVNNLMSNALKYTGRGGKIVLSIEKNIHKQEWKFTISDTGIGIPSKSQKKIFKPFFRADNVDAVSGTGIGLSLTRNLVLCMGGVIRFKSVEGKGSSFTVTLPLGYETFPPSHYVLLDKDDIDDYTLQHDESIKPDVASDNRAKILIVEDNIDMRIFLRQALQAQYIISEVENGREALSVVKKVNPEIIISDVMMPEVDGYELCNKIKSNIETSHIPVILLTVLDDQKSIQQGYQYGADNYIIKPFDVSTLILTIENTIATRRALRKSLINPLEWENNSVSEVNHMDKAFLDKVISVIKDNIDDAEFSIDGLSREMAMSRSSFFNKLKAVTGHNPNSFIRMIRLNSAVEMLREKKYTVAEVSYSVGFKDVKYFSTVFKKHFGVSPSKILDE